MRNEGGASAHKKWLGLAPLFDPEEGTTVVDPPGAGAGNWAGAPSALYDDEAQKFYLCYRLRRPLTEGRGWLCRIAESDDGVHLSDIWSARKEEFGSTSIERSCLLKTPEGRYRLYVSYVSGVDNRWRIDVLEAASPAEFDPTARRTVLTPNDTDSEGVKDPWVMIVGGLYYLFASYGPRETVVSGSTPEDLHGTGNVFTTGRVKHPTGLAVSIDGLHFDWRGQVLAPGNGWDSNMARMSALLYVPPVFTMFYDGRTGVGDVYEDKTGLAMSLDLARFDKVTPDGPILKSPHGSGALRYLDAVPLDGTVLYYYEYCRPDGSHELRMSRAAW